MPEETAVADKSYQDYRKDRISPATTEEVVKTAPVTEAGTEETEQQKEEKKSKGGFQRRIDKLTKTISSQEETLREERLARQRLEAQLAGKPAGEKEAVAGDDPEPKIDDYPDIPSFVKAQSRWAARQELKDSSAKQAKAEQDSRFQESQAAYDLQVEAMREKHDDFDEVVDALQGEAVPEPVARAIVELDNGAEVAYFLAKNPEVVTRLKEMSLHRAIAEIGRISDKLLPEEKEQQSPAKVTSAPAPIKPLGGSAKTALPLGQLNYRDYVKARREGRS